MDNGHEYQPPHPGPPEKRTAADLDRMVGVRLDADHFAILGTLAAREGLTPTAMARVLLRRALREAERGLELGL